MWLAEPHNVTSYQNLLEEHAADLFGPNHDPLPYYTCAAGLHRLNWFFGRPAGDKERLPPTYRVARFQLLYGIRLYLLGDRALPGRKDQVKDICTRMLDVLWHPTAGRELIQDLLPAISAARTPSGDLAKDVRSEEFTKKFGEAVRALPESSRAAA
jgi:hypothetical protein